MTIMQAFLCGLVYYLAIGNMPFVGLWTLQRPLVCGLVTGIILSKPLVGAMTGASINLVYLGFISAGGSMPDGIVGYLGNGLCDYRRFGYQNGFVFSSTDWLIRNDRLVCANDLWFHFCARGRSLY